MDIEPGADMEIEVVSFSFADFLKRGVEIGLTPEQEQRCHAVLLNSIKQSAEHIDPAALEVLESMSFSEIVELLTDTDASDE